MSRQPFVGGNFKCTGTAASLGALFKEFNGSITKVPNVDVVLAPGQAHLTFAKAFLHPSIAVASQNCYEKGGAFTGEVSPEQLVDMGLGWVILGHSERRHIFGESSDLVATKTKAALAKGLKVILCIGEKLDEREAGKTQAVCFEQLSAVLRVQKDWSNIVIAYEPVWAIGTGKVATPQQAQEACADIRKWLANNINGHTAAATRIIYGGSVNAKNVSDLWKERDVDGFLVGGASTKPEFKEIVWATTKPKSKL
eukprot:Sspe_Gene.4303::Locus_1415_Transcript_1_1_Confidence_1.000_Length_970::g.4303::m.4303/K01803/TPI, tpiA; triosephosphate isomerase (TIM)